MPIKYEPGRQAVQLDIPLAAAKVPTGHASQTPLAVAPETTEKLPAPHCEQAEAPVPIKYEPGTQAVQLDIPLAAAKVPAVHGPQEEEAGRALKLPTLQLEQVEAAEAPVPVK